MYVVHIYKNKYNTIYYYTNSFINYYIIILLLFLNKYITKTIKDY